MVRGKDYIHHTRCTQSNDHGRHHDDTITRTSTSNLLDDGLDVDVGHHVPGDEDEGVGSDYPPLIDVAKGVSRAQAIVRGDDSHLQDTYIRISTIYMA